VQAAAENLCRSLQGKFKEHFGNMLKKILQGDS